MLTHNNFFQLGHYGGNYNKKKEVGTLWRKL